MTMAETQSDRPALFTAEGTSAAPDHPALLGGRCRACGYVFFPMQTYGCEACGSADLEPTALAGRGRLTSFARVHVHASPGRAAPFTVGSIVTDDGAVVRALIDEASEAGLRHGAVMVTMLVPESRPGRGDFDLRFGLAAGAEA
jgi:uncharacterized OB-fold protein